MQTRLTFFLLIVGLTFVPVAIMAAYWTMLAVAFGWFIVVNLVALLLFRCPNCGRNAWRTNYGFFVPSVGTHCRPVTLSSMNSPSELGYEG